MRGLKLVTMYAKVNNIESHLLQMRGLKLEPWQYSPKKWSSHLLQMRGLKQKRCATSTSAQESHLLQMRGLKQAHEVGKDLNTVASFTDAWIETEQKSKLISEIKSHLLQMRGLKHLKILVLLLDLCRIFYRCVD